MVAWFSKASLSHSVDCAFSASGENKVCFKQFQEMRGLFYLKTKFNESKNYSMGIQNKTGLILNGRNEWLRAVFLLLALIFT